MKKLTPFVLFCAAVFAVSPLFAQNKGKIARSVKNALGAKTPAAMGVSTPKKALYVAEEQIAAARQLMLQAAARQGSVSLPRPAVPAPNGLPLPGLYERVRKAVAIPLLQKEQLRVKALTNRLQDSPLRPYDALVAGRKLVFVSGDAQLGAWNEVREVAASAFRARRPVVLASFHPFLGQAGTVPGAAFLAQMSRLGMSEWVELSVNGQLPLWEQAPAWNAALREKRSALRVSGEDPVVIVFGPAAWMEGENGFKLAGLFRGTKLPSSKDVAIISVQTGPAVTRTAQNWDELHLVAPQDNPYYSGEDVWPLRYRVDGHSALLLGSHAVVYTRSSYQAEH